MFSGDIFEPDNADHSLFPSQHGQLAEISFAHQLFRFSDGFRVHNSVALPNLLL
jgi:hypothetical protein